MKSVKELLTRGVYLFIVTCSVRYLGVLTAGLVLYRITADYWSMLPRVTQYSVWWYHSCYVLNFL